MLRDHMWQFKNRQKRTVVEAFLNKIDKYKEPFEVLNRKQLAKTGIIQLDLFTEVVII